MPTDSPFPPVPPISPLFSGESASGSRDSLAELEAIFELTVVGLVHLRDRIIVRCNHQAEVLFGYGPGEMVGQSTRIWYCSDEDFLGLGASAYPQLVSGQVHSREQMFCRRDGSTFWGRIAGRALAPETPFNCVLLLEDCSERKAAEERLQAALAEHQLIFDNTAIGFMFVRNRVIQRCNPRLGEMFGYSPEELIGQSTRILYPDDATFDWHGHTAYGVIRQGHTFTSEVAVRRKDGSLFRVRGSGRPIVRGERELEIIWTLEDVTELYAAEETLKHYQAQLENLVIERTAELEAANLRLQGEIQERRQAESRVWDMAHRDQLTQLPNRTLLQDRLQLALLQAQRGGHRVALMFLDIDRFKSVNDTLGHDAGDCLLQEVARRLVGVLRGGDTVARLGGDEFVLLLPEVKEPADAATVAEKILMAMHQPMDLDGHAVHFSASMGVALYPDDGEDPGALMRNADTAMYRAKSSGRDTVKFFTAEMNETVARLFRYESRMQRALERDEFDVFYQPLVNLRTGDLLGFEALMRWNSAEGPVSPAEFIPVAEESGLILALGDWVLSRACSQAAEWSALAGDRPLVVAVNLSARQFRHPGLVDGVAEVLARSGLSPSSLELEITESTLMDQGGDTLNKLHGLARMGVSLSIDDFGTGYSSLSYLKRFPVHKLKIDQTFVRDICIDRDDAAIVMAIINLAESLGLTTLAEGVENVQQLARLQEAGCRYCQGYYFSPPLPAAAATEFLKRALAVPVPRG